MQLAHTKARLTLAVGLVLSVGWIAVHTLSSPQTTVSSDSRTPPVPTSDTNHPQPQRPRLLSNGNHGASTTASDLLAAIAQLQAALTDPWPSRRAPVDRVIAALRVFGSDRGAALPTLMETLNRSDLGQKVLAAYGLIEMGHAAAESLTEILQMTTTGRIAVLNNTIPKLIEAVAPDLSPIPSLLAAMANPSATGREWIAEAILGLIQKFPDTSEAASIHATFADLLSADFQHVRREAAVALSRWPGEKSPEPVPILVDALALDRLRESNAGASIEQGATAITAVRRESRFEDVIWRFRAVKALRQLGPQARSSIAALDELRSLTAPDSELHREVLRALGTIDPARSSVDANIASAVAEGTRIESLPERLRAGQASFDEMVEGLRFRQTESDCARALEALGDAARPAVPALVYALDQFESYEAAQCLKVLAPDRLIDRVRLGQQTALGEVATALGDLGAAAKEAIPYLEKIGAEIPADQPGTAQAIADAIAAIDPQHPKTLYTFNDLWPATQALVREIQRSGKTQDPVYDLYLTRMQDLNAVPRARLLDFVNALAIDPDLRRVFVGKLSERNPELAAQLPPSP